MNGALSYIIYKSRTWDLESILLILNYIKVYYIILLNLYQEGRNVFFLLQPAKFRFFTSAKKCRDNLTVLKVSLAISSPLFLPNWMRFHDETLSLYLGCLAKSTHNIPIVKTFKQSESNNWLLLLSCKMPFLLHEISFEIYFLCL